MKLNQYPRRIKMLWDNTMLSNRIVEIVKQVCPHLTHCYEGLLKEGVRTKSTIKQEAIQSFQLLQMAYMSR